MKSGILSSSTAVILALASCSPGAPPAAGAHTAASASAVRNGGRSIVLFRLEQVPPDFGARVAAVGGTLESSLDAIGAAVVSGIDAAGAATLAAAPDVRSVVPDEEASLADGFVEDAPALDAAFVGTAAGTAPADVASPTTATLFARQWHLRAVGADKAWAAGHLGSPDVVIAIVDTGIDYMQPELKGLVDLERSKLIMNPDRAAAEEAVRLTRRDPNDLDSPFVYSEDAQGKTPRREFQDFYFHGTAVASTAATNAIRFAGVTRNVRIIAVKVGDRFARFDRSDLVRGVMYAADQGADVINTSIGGYLFRLPSQANPTGSQEILVLLERAYNYAFRKGTLMAGTTGNDAADNQHDTIAPPFADPKNPDAFGPRVRVCELGHTICTGATGPTSGSFDPATGQWTFTAVDHLASYSSYGHTDVVAPGGDKGPNAQLVLPCLTTPFTASPAVCKQQACRTALDTSTTALTAKDVELQRKLGGACVLLSGGTSFAAPHVVGLAALLVEQIGHGKPGEIRSRILQTATDLGDPGYDAYYGHGRIDVPSALGLPAGP